MWEIGFSPKAAKQAKKLKPSVLAALRFSVEDLIVKGPAVGDQWPHYGKLQGKKSEDKRHCHLTKGRPTYVCCWQLLDKKIKMIEIYYVGTHENAPY